jgi:hypothetical protein
MHTVAGTTRYTSSRRTTLVLVGFLLLTLLVPSFALIDEDNVRRTSDLFAPR